MPHARQTLDGLASAGDTRPGQRGDGPALRLVPPYMPASGTAAIRAGPLSD